MSEATPTPTRLAEVGERALIEQLRAIFEGDAVAARARAAGPVHVGASDRPAAADHADHAGHAAPPDRTHHPGRASGSLSTRTGIGDDCAVLAPPSAGREILLEVDEAIDHVHFRLDWMAPDDVGHRLATQGLSDVAAMGGLPRAALLALGAPAGLAADVVLGIARGLGAQLARFGVEVVGGNVAATPGPLHLTLTVVGEVEAGRAVPRAGAKPGHVLAVTGPIGLARAGWLLCERGLADRPGAAAAVRAYRRPEPRVAIGRALALASAASAMIDLSDGLAGDLEQLARASGVGAHLDEDLLPIGPELRAAAALLGEDPRALALAGGDDFELLVAVPPDRAAEAARAVGAAGGAWRRVGAAVAGAGLTLVRADGAREPLASGSYRHFA